MMHTVDSITMFDNGLIRYRFVPLPPMLHAGLKMELRLQEQNPGKKQ